LLNIRERSLLHEIGLKSGDRIESINGFDIANPEKALEAYARLRLAPKLKLVLDRRGAPLEIEYLIE
jgi:general secretion pathway protein C